MLKILISVVVSITLLCWACKSPQALQLSEGEAYLKEITAFRDSLNASYLALGSPLEEEDKTRFEGLSFFPASEEYRVVAKFRRTPDSKPFPMPTTSDRTPIYVQYGEAVFRLNGDEITLPLYRSPRLSRIPGMKYYLLLMFSDLTNGDTTYGGGRYISLTIPKGEEIVVDFNKAYHPYCLYNDKYSCPIPSSENFMDMEVRAGAKLGAFEKGLE